MRFALGGDLGGFLSCHVGVHWCVCTGGWALVCGFLGYLGFLVVGGLPCSVV